MILPASRSLAAALVAAALAGTAPATPATFFDHPKDLRWEQDRLILELEPGEGFRGEKAFLVAMAPGELELDLEAFSVRDLATGEAFDAEDLEVGLRQRVKSELLRRFEAKHHGWLRQQPVAGLRGDLASHLSAEGRSWELLRARLVLIPKDGDAGKAPPAADSAMERGPFRELLDVAVLRPGDLPALPSLSESPLPGPTEWQPLPQASPDFPWLRIPVEESALYRLDGLWLNQAGLDAATLAPEDLQMLRNGKPVPTAIRGPEGAGFAGGQYLIVYAQESSSPETRTQPYWLGRRTPGQELPRFASGPGLDPEAPELATLPLSRVVEQDLEFKTRFGTFLSIRAMNWVWMPLTDETPALLPFDTPGVASAEAAATSTTAELALYLAPGPQPNGARVTATLRDQVVLDQELAQAEEYLLAFEIPTELLRQRRNELRVDLRSPEGRPVQNLWVDQLRLRYPGRVEAAERQRVVDLGPVESGDYRLRATGFRSARRLLAVDLADPDAPALLDSEVSSGVTLVQVQAGPEAHVLLAEDHLLPRLPAPAPAKYAGLETSQHGADVLVVYHELLEEEARSHAANLETAGFETTALDVQSIYDSFSHGEISTKAIRNFLAWAVYEWEGRRPHSVILFGDASEDGRGLARNGVPNLIPIHTMEASRSNKASSAYVSDSWYSWLTEGDELADILVSRISTADRQEAAATVANMAAYRAASGQEAPWTDRLISVIDAGNFEAPLDEIVDEALAPEYEHLRLAANDFIWEDNYYLPKQYLEENADAKVSPLLTGAIEEGFNEGAAVVTFFGHGAPNLWSNQRFWFGGGTPNSDILRLRNGDRLPFVTSFTCNNATIGYPLEPWNICIAEDFLRHKEKGAIGAFMPAGPGFVAQHKVLAKGFLRGWSELGVRRHGVLAELARLNHQVREGNDDHSRMYIFLGDPTLELPPAAGQNGSRYTEAGDGTELLLRNVAQVEQTTRTLELPLAIELQADLPPGTQTSADLRALLLDGSGAIVDEVELAVTARSSGKIFRFLTLQAPTPGLYRIRMELPHESGAGFTSNLPSRQWNQWVVAGIEERLVLATEGTEYSPRDDGGFLNLVVANLGLEVRTAAISLSRPNAPEDAEPVAVQDVPLIRGGVASVRRIALPKELMAELREGPVQLQAEIATEGPKGPRQDVDRFPIKLKQAQLADLLILPESMRVLPDSPSEGVTLLVDGVVVNRGKAISSAVRLQLSREDDAEARLRDLSGTRRDHLAPLRPGEERAFRLRWDPFANAGSYDLTVTVDSTEVLPESDEDNNTASVAVEVRRSWDLKPGDLAFDKGGEGELVLTAGVVNRGETDARNVTVNFYRTQEQTEETKLGEILLERVPAAETTVAVLRYQFDRTEGELEIDPSFTVALKGSQQRVSSVAEAP